jgi:hypothetical protein
MKTTSEKIQNDNKVECQHNDENCESISRIVRTGFLHLTRVERCELVCKKCGTVLDAHYRDL